MTAATRTATPQPERIAPARQGAMFDPDVRRNVDPSHELVRIGIHEDGAPIELLNGIKFWKDRRDRERPGLLAGNRHRMAVITLYDGLFDASRHHHRRPMGQQLDSALGEYRQRTVLPRGETVSRTHADGTVVTTPADALLP